jgi:hypothetical protein
MTSWGDTVYKIKTKFTDTIVQNQFFTNCNEMFCYFRNMHVSLEYRKFYFSRYLNT